MNSRLIPGIILGIYSLVILKLALFRTSVIRTKWVLINVADSSINHSNFVPLKTILPYLLGEPTWRVAIINLVENIILFVPIGLLLPFVYTKMTWQKSFGVAALTGLFIETMEVVLGAGIFDIDDVLLNGLGIMIGYWAFVILVKFFKRPV